MPRISPSTSSRSLPRRQQVLDRDDQWRVGDDSAFAVDLVGQLGERLHAVLGSGLRDVRPSLRPLLLGGYGLQLLEQRLNLDVGIPDIQVAHRGSLPHPGPVLRGHRQHDRAPLRGREPAIPAGDLETRGQPLHVPLPRARQRLVEIVDVEHQLPLGGGEHPEVRQVRVAANLDRQPGARGGGQVGGHDQRGTPVERERRHQHPAVTDRNQLRNPACRLLLQQPDRVGAVGRRLPAAMAGPRNLITRRLPPGDTLLRESGARPCVRHHHAMRQLRPSAPGASPPLRSYRPSRPPTLVGNEQVRLTNSPTMADDRGVHFTQIG